MIRLLKRLFVLSLLLVGSVAMAAEPAKPELWIFPPALPDGTNLRELFQHPEQWTETRSQVQVLGYADHMLHKQFTDDELRAWLPRLTEWRLQLALEVGCVKPWGVTGKEAFAKQKKMWERFESLGGKIGVFALDEPLVCTRNDLKKPDAYAVEETAHFIALVRQHYPQARIGDIEAYPFASVPDLIAFIDGVEKRLKELKVRGMDFFQLDVDWVHFVMDHPGGWTEVKKLENACRARKIPFSLLYWAADHGHLKRDGLADDATWHLGVMRQGSDYHLVHGRPDIVNIESWVGAPTHAVPETAEDTFTRSVRDFARKYARPLETKKP